MWYTKAPHQYVIAYKMGKKTHTNANEMERMEKQINTTEKNWSNC